MEYQCKKCGMSVKGMSCGECSSELEHDIIKDEHGEKVAVSKCPNGCGMIKSPTCCRHDMAAS